MWCLLQTKAVHNISGTYIIEITARVQVAGNVTLKVGVELE